MKTKSIIVLALAAILFGGVSTSCKSSKTTTSDEGPSRVKRDKSDAQKYYEAAPTFRGWGTYTHQFEEDAIAIASAEARRMAAGNLEEWIRASVDESGDQYRMKNKTEAAKKIVGSLSGQIDQIVKGYVVVKTDVYENIKDNSLSAYVCVEFQEDLIKLSKRIAKMTDESLSEEDKMVMDFKYEEYQKMLEQRMKEYKERRAEK